MNQAAESLDVRIAVLAGQMWLPGLPVVPDDAIPLALDLLAADRDTPGTVEVASLAPGTTMRDAEGSIRQMVAEQGFEPRELVDTEEGRYEIALWVFGRGGMRVGEFSQWFYSRLSAWEQQGETDRAVVLLLDEWEHAGDPASRAEVETKIREVAARA
jgi:hypothetical protein